MLVLSRKKNETLVIVRNEINVRPLRDLEERRRLAHGRALAFREELEADRRSRVPGAGERSTDPTPASAADSVIAP